MSKNPYASEPHWDAMGATTSVDDHGILVEMPARILQSQQRSLVMELLSDLQAAGRDVAAARIEYAGMKMLAGMVPAGVNVVLYVPRD